MATEDKSNLAVWLDFAKALVWPLIILVFLLLYKAQFSELIKRVTEVHVPGGTSIIIAAAAQQAAEVQRTITREAQPGAPTDPRPSLDAIKQVLKVQALRTLAQQPPTLTSSGWIYCGELVDGHWINKPNLIVAGPVESGKTYTVFTDTYLRENPPQGSTPKGEVIGVVPQGAQVKVLQVNEIPDPSRPSPDKRLVWVQIENKTTYAVGRNQ
jgi:hypothetical protein